MKRPKVTSRAKLRTAMTIYRGEFADVPIPEAVVEWFESLPRGKTGKKTKAAAKIGRQIMESALRHADADLAWAVANGWCNWPSSPARNKGRRK